MAVRNSRELRRVGCALLLLGMLLVGRGAVQAAPGSECPFRVPFWERIDCGWVTVPENRAQPEGRTVQIAYAIVHSHNAEPAPDPIIFLNGGPGPGIQAAVDALSQYEFLLIDRDLILFDPRGEMYSQPQLDCPELGEPGRRSLLGESVPISDWLTLETACLERWQAQGIDLTQYNSYNNALDVRDLWRALGYEQVNLFAVSYGTVPAQILMREVPGELRAVVMDSPLPLDTRTGPIAPQQIRNALQSLFARCADDFLCRLTYPDLPDVYNRLVERTFSRSIPVPFTDPVDGSAHSFNLDPSTLGMLIAYTPARVLPFAIYELEEGHFDMLIEQREALVKELARSEWGKGFGFSNSVFCNETMFLMAPGERAASDFPEAKMLVDAVQESLCQNWAPGPLLPLHPLARADVPTLIFVGQFDTRLPADYAQRIAEALPRGQWYLFSGTGHGVFGASPCANALSVSFLTEPEAPLDARCVASADISHQIFDTRFLLRGALVLPFVQVGVGLLAVAAVLAVCGHGWKFFQHRFSIAWKMAYRCAGWGAPLLTVVLLGGLYLVKMTRLRDFEASPLTLLTFALAMGAGVQAAQLFSPQEEPALELQLAAPRPVSWLVLERWGFVVGQQLVCGLLFTLGITVIGGATIEIGHWLASLLFFAGLGVAVSALTRRTAMGVLVVVLVGFLFQAAGDGLVKRIPVLWAVHPFLSSTAYYYEFNRWFLALLGIALVWVVTGWRQNDEQLLFGGGQAGGRRSGGLFVPVGAVAARRAPAVPPSARQVRWAQLAALVRMELWFLWHRRSLVVTGVALIALPLLGALVSAPAYQSYREIVALGGVAAVTARHAVTLRMLPYFLSTCQLVFSIFLPVMVADIIPLDAHVGMRELLNSLPLSRRVYLAGKVLSVVLGVVLITVALLVIAGGVWWLGVAPFEIPLILELVGVFWVMGVVNGASVVLLASRARRFRSALQIGALYAGVCGATLLLGIFLENPLLKALLPGRPAVILYYILLAFQESARSLNITPEFAARFATHADLVWASVAGLLQVGVIGWWVGRWNRDSE